MGFQIAPSREFLALLASSDDDDARAHAQAREDRLADFTPAAPPCPGAQTPPGGSPVLPDGPRPCRSSALATGRPAGTGLTSTDKETAAALPRPAA